MPKVHKLYEEILSNIAGLKKDYVEVVYPECFHIGYVYLLLSQFQRERKYLDLFGLVI